MNPVLVLAMWSGPAHALSCDDVMNMINVNVPTSIVVQTIAESGERFNADFVRCLTNEGAPAEVIDAARRQMASAATPKEDDEPAEAPATNKVVKSKPAASDLEDAGDAIGSRTSSRGRELADKDDEESGDKDPARLETAVKQYKSKKPLSASYELYDMLSKNDFPDKETKIQYYLALSLYDLQMYNASQYYFIEVLKKGTGTPYFKYALPKVVTISKFTGDESDLSRIVGKISPDDFPRGARNQLYYLLALRMMDQDKLSEARKYLGQVSEKSDLYTRAKYLEGIIYNKQDKLKSAVRSFIEVSKTQGEAQTQQELEQLNRIRDLSLLNIARIYYAIQRYPEAQTYYGYVPRSSRYWAEGQFESAWTNFMLSDLNLTLGQVLTLESPFYRDDEFIPEATVLKALTFFNLCEYGDVERLLTEFDARNAPIHQEMKDVLKTYSSEEGKKLADQAFDRYFGPRPDPTVIPKSLFKRMLRNQELAGLVSHLESIDREEQLIAQQKSQWKNSVGEHLNKVASEDRERLKGRAGRAMLSEMVKMTNYLGDLIGQAQIIKFEVVDARRADYTYRLANPDLQDTSRGQNLDFATSSRFIYWPFNGEFWQDELGYYRYTEQGSCK
jgi:tetratricopeptide (TPR) repeat protein